MADSNFTIKVNVADGGDIEKIKRALAGLGATVDTSRKRLTAAEKAAADFTRTQNQGVAGIANSTRSFSKLAETIGRGGSSGLVGAYATLAANAFAVTAAFNALKNAAQVEQIFTGLEAAGYRTGRSLTSTAKALKEVTGDAISSADALKATAQISSAGFNGDAITRLGKAARDTSFALGRSMTDSLERLSRGVVKLEPELLDELGIMTKIGESNALYATQLGKTESQLSNFEKRQGFLNAVLNEAELKFGGLSDSAGDTTSYDRLSAKFVDLTNSILNGINTIAKPIAGILSSSSLALTGVLGLFAATLKNQLLPGLANGAAAALAQAEALKVVADQKKKNIIEARALAREENKAALTSKMNFNEIGKGGPKAYQALADSIRAGTASLEEQERGIKSLEKSRKTNESILVRNPKYNIDPNKGTVTDKGLEKVEANKAIDREIAAIRELQNARENADKADVAGNQKVQKARRQARLAAREALAQSASAATIGAASQLKLGVAWNQLTLSVRAYASAQAMAADGGVTGMMRLRTATFAASTAAKALGAAFLTTLPYLGLITVAVGLVVSAIESMKSDKTKAMEKAFENLNESTSKTGEYLSNIKRANESLAPAALRTAEVMTIQSNAIAEATGKFNELLDASGKFNAANKDMAQGVAGVFESYNSKNFASYILDLDKGSKALELGKNFLPSAISLSGGIDKDPELAGALKAYDAVQRLAPKATAEVEKLYGGFKNLQNIKDKDKFIATVRGMMNEVNTRTAAAAQNVKALQEAFKNLEQGLSDFSLGSIINTPYDATVKNMNSLRTAIMDFKEQAVISGDADWQKLLTGIGSKATALLDVTTQKELDRYRAADATVQALQSQLDKGQKISGVQLGQLKAAKELVATGGDLAAKIEIQSSATRELFVSAQRQTREYQMQQTLLSAHLQANQALYAAAGAGLRARYAQEERIREVQKAQITVQVQIEESMIRRQSLRVQELKDLGAVSRQQAIILAQTREQQKQDLIGKINSSGVTNTAAIENSNMNSRTFFASRDAQRMDPEEAKRLGEYIDSYNTLRKVTADQTKMELERATELEALQNSIRDSESSILNLRNQLAALSEQDLTTAEKLAKIREADNDAQRGLLASLKEQRKTLREVTATYENINAVISGTADSLAYQIRTIKTATAASEENIRASANNQITKLKDEIANARASANRPNLSKEEQEAGRVLVQNLEKQLEIQRDQLNVDLGKLDAETKLSIVQKVYFDTAKEGLEWQKTSLDYVQKELDAYRSLADEAQKNFELRVKLRAAQRGVQVTETGQQALDINAARMTYKLAVEESSIKKALIDLEFALLDAQRDQLASELRARRDNIDKNDTVRIAQLDGTISRLESIDLSKIADASKKVIDSSVENARVALQTVLTPKGREGPFGAITAAVEDFRLLQQQRAEAAKDNPTPIQVTKIVGAETVAQKMARAIETSTDPVVVSNVKLANKIDEAIAVIEKSIGAQRSEVSSPSSMDGGTQATSIGKNVGARVKEALEFFMSKGYTLNQSAGLVGNLQQESGLDPNLRNSIGAYGIAQWLSKDRVNEFVKKFGRSLQQSTFREQLEFIVHELNTTEKAAGRALKATTTLEQATMVVRKKYERPAEWEAKYPSRLRFAKASVNTRGAEPQVSSLPSRAAEELLPARSRRQAAGTKPIEVVGPGNTGGRDFSAELSKMPQGSLESDGGLVQTQSDVFDKLSKKVEFTAVKEALNLLDSMTAKTLEQLGELGPEGEIIQVMYAGMTGMTYSIVKAMETMNSVTGDTAEGFAKRFSAIAAVAQQTIGMIQGILAANTRAKEELIDREIAAEQRRDGKSAESVSKIASMEKKKDDIARKQFNTNKKLMMAQAVISTATGVASALAIPFIGIPLAAAIAALGAAQIAIIAGTSYQSSATNAASNFTTPTLTIGKRGDNVDLAKQNNNVGGELGYLRGRQGTGSNSSNYSVIGSAYGGELPRGYGNTSYVVGEKGPETIEVTPDRAMSVRPANATPVEAGRPIEAHISIQALDGASVESVIRDQRGNIISMLREAANANGTPFMEDVNVQVYSSPNKGRKI